MLETQIALQWARLRVSMLENQNVCLGCNPPRRFHIKKQSHWSKMQIPMVIISSNQK
jgi:hypothetical protein